MRRPTQPFIPESASGEGQGAISETIKASRTLAFIRTGAVVVKLENALLADRAVVGALEDERLMSGGRPRKWSLAADERTSGFDPPHLRHFLTLADFAWTGRAGTLDCSV